MQSYVAEIGELVRSHRRDEEEIETLQERISNIVKELGGQRFWLKIFPYLPAVSKIFYYCCTSLTGVQTLGEEYVRLFQTLPDKRILPAFYSRFLFVIFHILLPLFSKHCIQKAQYQLNHPATESFLGIPITNNQKARKSFQALVEWIRATGIPQLRRIHLAIFYINGLYYNISRRAAGIRYQSLSPQTNIGALKVYRILGYLTLAQTLLSLILWIGAKLEAERQTAKQVQVELSETVDIKEQFIHTWFRCSVCLEPKEPSATPCGHLFCWSCIQEHSLTSEGESKCPQCRSIFDPSRIVPLLNL